MKKIYLIWILLIITFIVLFNFIEKTNFIPVFLLMFFIWLIYFIKEVVFGFINIKFYNNYCKFGILYIAKTKYDKIKSIVITDHTIRTRSGEDNLKIKVKTNKGLINIPIAYVSLHSSKDLKGYIHQETSKKYDETLNLVNYKYHRTKNINFNSSDLKRDKSFITGFPLKNGKSFYNFLKYFKGSIYIKMSIYNYHKDYLDYLFKHSLFNLNQVIIVDDGINNDVNINLLFLYKKHIE